MARGSRLARRGYRAAMAGSDTPSLESLTDLCTPWCIHVAATLRIPHLIADGTDGVAELAEQAGCDPDVLHSVLGHLAAKGVLAEGPPGRFGLTDLGKQLLEASPFLDLDGIGGRMAHAWGTLLTYVRTGRPAYHEVFGAPFWEDLATHPEVAASFDALMGPAGHGAPDIDLPLAGGWEGVQTVVDVGGGTGALLAALLQAHPHLEGTLVDLPGTVARSAPTFAAAEVTDQATAVAQSFFDPLPAGADVYLLMKVLNDWPDDVTTAILRRCAEAVPPTGRILVVGGVAPDDAPHGLVIEMVLLGGRTDSLVRFRQRAAEAGLAVTATGRTGAGRFAVECRRAGAV